MDLDNSRAAVGSSITAANVSRLKVAWTGRLPGAQGLSTAPVVVDEILVPVGKTNPPSSLALSLK